MSKQAKNTVINPNFCGISHFQKNNPFCYLSTHYKSFSYYYVTLFRWCFKSYLRILLLFHRWSHFERRTALHSWPEYINIQPAIEWWWHSIVFLRLDTSCSNICSSAGVALRTTLCALVLGFMMQVLKSLHIMRQTQQHQSEQLMMITDMLHHVDGPPAEPLSFAQFETLQEFLAFEKELTACEQKRVQLVSSRLRCTLFYKEDKSILLFVRPLRPSYTLLQ